MADEQTLGSQRALFHAWGWATAFRCLGTTAVTVWSLGRFRALGHPAMLGVDCLVFDRRRQWLVHLIGGPGFDPTIYRGKYSGFARQ